MSQEWDKQKKRLTKGYGVGPDTNSFGENTWRRQMKGLVVQKQRQDNTDKRGNPLSVVANEKQPNPSKRDRLMKLARFNKDSGR